MSTSRSRVPVAPGMPGWFDPAAGWTPPGNTQGPATPPPPGTVEHGLRQVPAIVEIDRVTGELVRISAECGELPVVTYRSRPDGGSRNARLGGVEKMMQKYGVVADGVTDDASALQECINAARVNWGGAFPMPTDISVIKINSGIELLAETDRFTADRGVLIDASGVTTGAAITVNGTIADGNVAALRNILNGLGDIRLVGAGTPFVPGATGVVGIRFRGTGGKAYFYQAKRLSIDGFEVCVDLAGNTFGIAFEDFTGRAGMGGTIVQCLSGDGSDYGERYNFTRAMLYNSERALLNTAPAANFRFINSSFDYCRNMADVRAGRVSLTACHIETNQDFDYLFKLSGNEAAAISISQSELVLNAVNRTNFEIFDITDDVKFGGYIVRDTMIAHGSGYSLPTYVRGKGPAVLDGHYKFVNAAKIPFSKFMSRLRSGFDTAEAIAEWSVSGGTVTRDTTVTQSGAGSLRFNANAADTTVAIIRQIEPGKMPSMSYYYRKTDSTTGQGLLRVRLDWQDSVGATISTIVLEDLDGNTEWTLRRSSVNARPPIGAVQYRLRFIKSADSGNAAQIWIDELVLVHT